MLVAAVVLALSCSTVPPPAAIVKSAELAGEIRPARASIAVGETLVVDYLLRNLTAQRLELDVADPATLDGPADPGRPFQGYGFNGRAKADRKTPLPLEFLGGPLVGLATIEPGATLRFQRATWRADKPGDYVLSFTLEWRAGQLVPFEEVTITVTPGPGSGSGTSSDASASQTPEK